MTRTGASAAVRPATSGGAAPARQHIRAFPALLSQVGEARRFLASVLADCPFIDEAILCLSELAANACIHSASRLPGGTFTMHVSVRPGEQVRLEVADNGGPWIARAHDDDRPHGLTIVAGLARDYGVHGDVFGRLSWATLDWPHSPEQTCANT
jgi:serine/threonine-protein kinase RsbW